MKNKIPFYNIVNMFFVGSIFTFIIVVLFHNKLGSVDFSKPIFIFMKDWNIITSTILLIVMYEIGFVLNRASSVIIEPILTKTKIWPKYQYDKDVSEISENNSKFESMITELVLTRTHILLYSVVGVISIFSTYKLFSVVCLALVIIFIFAGRKHNAKINKIRKSSEKTRKKSDKEAEERKSFIEYNGNFKK